MYILVRQGPSGKMMFEQKPDGSGEDVGQVTRTNSQAENTRCKGLAMLGLQGTKKGKQEQNEEE